MENKDLELDAYLVEKRKKCGINLYETSYELMLVICPYKDVPVPSAIPISLEIFEQLKKAGLSVTELKE